MFFNKKKNACPICTENMTYRNGRFVCSSCGYHIAAHDLAKSDNTSVSTETPTIHPARSTQTATVSNKPVQTKPPVRQTKTATVNPQNSGSSKTGKKRRVGSKIVLAVSIVLTAAIRFLPTSDIIDLFTDNNTPASTIPSIDYSELTDNTNQILDTLKENQESMEALINNPAFYLPQSDMFKRLISETYNKDYLQVTRDELAAFIALDISHDENYYRTITYTLQSGETGTIYFNDETVTTSDLSCFTGLESLHLEGCYLEKGDLDGLDNLAELWCDEISVTDLSDIIDPEQLTSLGFECNPMNGGLSGIDICTNLTSLYVEGYYYLTDISSISALENLKQLEIVGGNDIESFAVLYDMPQLTSLSIDSDNLRDIGFVSNMPNLTELTIHNSELMNVEALSACADTLTKLDLSDNYYVEDYSVVSEFTKLTDLTLVISYMFDDALPLPELGNMPELTKLHISGYDDLSQLADAVMLEELTLESIYSYDYSPLENLTLLKRLNMTDMSCDPPEVAPIMALTQLEEIYLEDSFIWGNIEWVLNMPSLREFHMDEYSTAGFDVENLTLNENLEVFSVNGASLRALVDGEWDYQIYDENEIDLSQHTDIFEYYPNLQELHLANNTLSDLSFAENLTELRILDITDNYVTSLAPLKELPELHSVICATNPIVDDAGLGDAVITEN